ncbi:MAG: hypothetical protein KJO07_14510, partial [Deltaproteobacteria bacterium]|nr:hypothetical protein [Deltaproteobacteria bacterium]
MAIGLLVACGGNDSSADNVCAAPTEDCGGECVNTDNDPGHCGGCDIACDAGQVCGGGQCLDDCPAGTEDCDGTCADTSNDPANCGGCGTVCGDDEECRDSSCEIRCDAGLNAAVSDPWGAQWDGVERSAATLAEAAADCESFGARLPNATELYRVNPAVGGTIGTAADTNPLWSLVPYDATQQVAVTLADGATSEVAATNSAAYRCVCAPPPAQGFRSSSCYGDPGSECTELPGDGGRMNIDSLDRPALRKSSAIFECAAAGGRLATLGELHEAIAAGIEGSGSFLQTADDAIRSHYSSIAWTGSNPAIILSDSTLTADVAQIEDITIESK